MILTDLASGEVEKIIWASFGDKPESWFVAYGAKDKVIYRTLYSIDCFVTRLLTMG